MSTLDVLIEVHRLIKKEEDEVGFRQVFKLLDYAIEQERIHELAKAETEKDV